MNQVSQAETPTLAEQASDVSRVVGIMSGKGGVGKSLVTALLASAFAKSGSAVGVMDADITGPSIPTMFGVHAKPEVAELGMIPPETPGGIKLISINLFLDDPSNPVIWRGPLLSSAVKQFWNEVFWGKLDYLFVDLPPGTSDVPLTVIQALPLDGMIIVTSPQDLATQVVRKAVNMCRKMEVQVLGLVENMTHVVCPTCGGTIYPFGQRLGQEAAQLLRVPHLFDLPIDPEISQLADSGHIEDYRAAALTQRLPAIANVIEACASARKAREHDRHEPAEAQA